jgi:hypothetical protein
MKSPRFSKATLAGFVFTRIEFLEKQWGFDERNGPAQVEGSEPERVIAYGEWDLLHRLLDEFNLENPSCTQSSS